MQAREISFKIVINGKDATKDLSPYIINFTYVDNKTDKADELQVDLDNTDQRFLNDWFFSAGMSIEAWIGQMYCGKFVIDQPEEYGPPDTVCFRAQSALFSGPIRTPRSFVHENKTLEQIVKKYADEHKLKVVGTIPDLNLKHFVQMRESDIDFMHRVAERYGCHCSVKGDTLLFDAIENQWKNDVCKTIKRADIMSYRFTTSLTDAPDAAAVKFNDAHEDEVKEAAVANDTVTYKTKTVNPALKDVISYQPDYDQFQNINPEFVTETEVNEGSMVGVVKHTKAESKAEAKLIAKGIVMKGRQMKHRFTITLPLDELLVAGQNIKVEEFGKRSGFWAIDKSTHKFGRGGSNPTTTIEGTIVSKLGGVSKVHSPAKAKPKINGPGRGNYIDDVNGGKNYGFGKTFMHGK